VDQRVADIIGRVSPARTPPRIFISYRRDDAAGDAGRLADHLSRRFGADAIFLDIETIDPGTDFVDVLQTTLQRTSVVLVVIGRRWISLQHADGRRRLDDEHDFVRLADVGIRGNGHMMMLEKNNLEIAAFLRQWVEKNIS
jgi:hypothetical protein